PQPPLSWLRTPFWPAAVMEPLSIRRSAGHIAQVFTVYAAGRCLRLAPNHSLGRAAESDYRRCGVLSVLPACPAGRFLAGGDCRLVLSVDRILYSLAGTRSGRADGMVSLAAAGGGQDRATNRPAGTCGAGRGDGSGADQRPTRCLRPNAAGVWLLRSVVLDGCVSQGVAFLAAGQGWPGAGGWVGAGLYAGSAVPAAGFGIRPNRCAHGATRRGHGRAAAGGLARTAAGGVAEDVWLAGARHRSQFPQRAGQSCRELCGSLCRLAGHTIRRPPGFV